MRFRRTLLALTILAFLLRLAVAVGLSSTPAVFHPSAATDMATYRNLALGVLRGQFPPEFDYQPFYYTVFLPAVFLVFGSSWWAVAVVQAGLGAATVFLAGLIGAQLFGRRAGAVAAFLLAFYRMHLFYTPFLLIVTAATFVLALWVWAGLRAWRANTVRAWTAAAFLGGVGVIVRGNFLLLLPALFGLILYRNRRRFGRAVRYSLIAAFVAYLPQFPYALYNYEHLHRWTGASTAGPKVFALGNTPEAPAGGLEYPPAWKEWMREAALPRGRRVPILRNFLHWFQREPLAWFELKWRAFLMFWWHAEIPNNVSLQREGRASLLVQAPLLFGFGLVGPLALAGLLATALRWVRSPRRTLAAAGIVLYCGGTVLFYILARFRVPLVPLLVVFASAYLDAGVRIFERGKMPAAERRRRFLMHLGMFAGCLAFTTWGYPLYHSRFEAAVVRWVRPCGVTVRLERGLRVHDHGPMAFGGWAAAAVAALPNTEGLRFEKRFCPAPALASPGRLAGRMEVRVPVTAPKDTAVEVSVSCDGHRLESPPAPVRAGRVAWIRLTLPGPRTPQDFRVGIRIRSLGPAPVFPVVDRCRWYGRTRWPSGPARAMRAEACVEVLLPWASRPAGPR